MSDQPDIRLATPEGECIIHQIIHRWTHILTRPPDVPTTYQFILDLASHQSSLHKVTATPDSLLKTLSFLNASPHKPGGAYTALITPPATPEIPTPAPVGMALFYYNYSSWRAAPGIYLEQLYVQSSVRGGGYGFKLLKYLAKKVVEIGGERLEWSVLRENEKSIRFYERVGAEGREEWVKMMLEEEGWGQLAGAVGANVEN
ncbi:hypothetical protein SI65_04594 [Aspergillus cristatus]|uniref:N-acetyltransferase domain-containing protein n=1 Tax=Aspergillus cristatus TaxID=573508 RepID=A0A1E3BF94_ASPCR|nr:hypothetical protein SI65_04594 [Aspergillus cristatus]